MAEKLKKISLIGDRIKERRNELSLARPDVCRELGIAVSTLQMWEQNEREPNASKIIELARVLDMSANYLLTGEKEERAEFITQVIKPDANLQASNDETFSVIEDCREVRISAGGGGFNDEYKPYQTTKVEKAWLDLRRLKAEDCAMFLVSGDSMYPTLKDGEEIIVDRSKKELKDGKIFVLNNEGAMLVKKVQITYNGITLISQNTEYAPIELNAEQANNLIVIGQVVRGYRDF